MQTQLTTAPPDIHPATDDAVTIRGLVKHYPDPRGGTFAAVDGLDDVRWGIAVARRAGATGVVV